MKLLFFTAVYLFMLTSAFGQFGDTYQPAAIYRQNNVKARVMMYERARWKARIMADLFDHNGLVTDHREYDTLGEKLTYRELISYDSSQKIISLKMYWYFHIDTAQKKWVFDSVPASAVVNNEYDSLNRLVRRSFYNSADKIQFEITQSYNPLTKTVKKYYADSSRSIATYDYDVPFIENKTTDIFYFKNGHTSSVILTYKNHFDKTGKIKRRKVRDESTAELPSQFFYYREIEYQYLNNGLLIRKLSSNSSDNSYWQTGMLFDYKFW